MQTRLLDTYDILLTTMTSPAGSIRSEYRTITKDHVTRELLEDYHCMNSLLALFQRRLADAGLYPRPESCEDGITQISVREMYWLLKDIDHGAHNHPDCVACGAQWLFKGDEHWDSLVDRLLPPSSRVF